MKPSPLAGKPAPPTMLVNVPRLVASYYTEVPDPSIPAQRVVFGTSGHRGSAFEKSFNEWHVLAISQAICQYRNGAASRVREAPATPEQKQMLAQLSPQQILSAELAGETIQSILTQAPGNGAPIGGLKVITGNGLFAARPSGTEDMYKIYAESFRGTDHLRRILAEAQAIVDAALAADPLQPGFAARTNLKARK